MNISPEQIDKLLYELRRIANAAEVLAMHAEPQFSLGRPPKKKAGKKAAK